MLAHISGRIRLDEKETNLLCVVSVIALSGI